MDDNRAGAATTGMTAAPGRRRPRDPRYGGLSLKQDRIPQATLDVYRGRSPGPYVPGTPWKTWWRLFQNFLALRRVTDEGDKRLIFLQEVGAANYELLGSLLQGKQAETATMAQMEEVMEQHFQPKKLLMAENFGLMSKTQKHGQTLQEYYANLQKAANTCGFERVKDHRDMVVAMVFIGGLQSVETRKRLLEREELSSKEVLEAAEAFERDGSLLYPMFPTRTSAQSMSDEEIPNKRLPPGILTSGARRFRGKKQQFGAWIDLYVLPTASRPLCGRDMIKKLQINCGPHVRVGNKLLFEKGIGRCTTAKVALKFKQGSEKPKFCRVRPVPIALRPKVEEKLQEMVTVNPQLDINQYPLPKPDDLFHMLQKFSKMDLPDAYMQGVIIYLDDITVTAPDDATHLERLRSGVIIYLDDITVTAPDDATHLERLRSVLKRLKEAGFRLKREKCEFLKEQMEFLSHVVDAQGVRPSPKKIQAMVNMPEPKNLKEVESFIGMVQYYGKFIPNLSTIAAPLNELRKKGASWRWEAPQKEAFKKIKQRLTEADVLTHYGPQIPVVLATDASDYGLGAVVYHKMPDGKEKVIAYASRTLTKEERNYAQIEKEALGIVYGVEKFNQFLYGRRFTLLTDHKPLVKIFGPKNGIPTIAAKMLHRWSLRLMIYSFDIEYRNTSEFGNADGLSRLPDPRESPSAEMVISEVKEKHLTAETWENMVLSEEEIAKATKEEQTLQKRIAQACGICAAFGNDPIKTRLHPWEEPQKVWQRLHMDFCETQGTMWLVVVDAKSKWPEDKWVPGIITDLVGSNTYRVHVGTGSRMVHADQLKKRVTFWEEAP
ncbi:unnamed protein product [Nippostrongylus brasiliensis]|uniref:RNA-directed DNA polymerase n=1 Tax=Nippostrongylus brasiliensis TaxID=27835 RepID=A0A0N4YNV9_NIPBR|nr:unnamed protein product [Nippostrongylus brasiliensis]